jgi:uncharacterized protein YndB with AHSA1/START domain
MRPVAFDVPVEVAFDYLVDPRNRPQWQSSLRRVEAVDGDPRVGQRWTDVTAVGVRPAMQTVALDRPRSWTEAGTWRGVEATLTLQLTATGHGCTVLADFAVSAPGIARPLGPLLTRAARPAVRNDLERAARILSERGR